MDNEQKLSLMRTYIELFNKESTLAIYLLLGIKGQMTPHELITYTTFGKATVFRSLKALLDSELVATEIDPKIVDKRKNKVYFVIKELDTFPEVDEEFISYCIQNSYTDDLKDFIVFIRSIAVNSMKVSMDFRDKLTADDSEMDWYSKLAEKGTFAFSIYDLEEYETIRTLTKEFIVKIENLPNRKKKMNREPMKNPIILSIGVLPLKNINQKNS